MKDKICVITGANSGIGKSMAKTIARKNARIVMVCRNLEKAEQTRQEIISETRNEAIDIFLADLSKQAEIRKVAEEIQSKYARIDVLINNAGLIAKSYRELTQDGLELTFAINHIAYFMLTNLLIDQVKASGKGRIISVSSEAHRFATLDLENLQLEKGYNNMKAYALSKLCNILFTRELAKRLQGTDIVANCFHPGGVATNFAQDASPWMRTLMNLGKPFLSTPDQGADTGVYLATNPEVGNISGEYFARRHVKLSSREARDELKAKRLWEVSAELSKLKETIY
ncbi:MAG: SDR family oxidoreductase [Microscillaceae bacterium]|nr:SDR family oxidoreductase [Microscillaceae bacterium]